jgi:hypothetical protein
MTLRLAGAVHGEAGIPAGWGAGIAQRLKGD